MIKKNVTKDSVLLFDPYPFAIGQKIRITGGHRSGDWLVVGLSDKKVTLRCPVSSREFEWDRFCYLTSVKENIEWPKKD